jgi:hypothetical protein
MTDYRNIQDLDSFDNLVENFVSNRKKLKTKVKEERGDISRKKADAKLKAEPITESINELRTKLTEKGGFLKMFERFSAVSKSQSEIKLTTKPGEGKLGTSGYVDLADLQDGILRVRNSRTGDTIKVQLDEDLAELLFKPYRNIDMNEIEDSALNQYYRIMLVAGMSGKSNNNNKTKKARQVYNAINQQAPPPAQPPQQPPMPPAQPPRRPRPNIDPMDEQKESDSDEMSEGDVIQEEERGRPQQPREQRGRPERFTGRKYKGRLDLSNEERRAIKREEKIEKRISDVRGRRSQRRAEEAQQFRQRRRQQRQAERDEFYTPEMRMAEVAELRRDPNDPTEERGQVYAMDRGNMYSRKRQKRGRGLMSGDDMINHFHMLCKSKDAGNYSDEMVNEMMDLLDGLLQNRFITKSQYKTLYHNYIE